MNVKETKLKGLFLIEPEVKGDERGFFMEVFRQDYFAEAGLRLNFVQTNHSRSVGKILRGLHFQYDQPLGKLIRIINGDAFVVAADIRKNSATLGEWLGFELSSHNKKLLYVPPGFASGFCVLGDLAEVEYQYTALYNQNGESNIAWNDPDLDINWPIENPTLSLRDQNAESLKAWLSREEADIFKV